MQGSKENKGRKKKKQHRNKPKELRSVRRRSRLLYFRHMGFIVITLFAFTPQNALHTAKTALLSTQLHLLLPGG